VGFPIVVLLLCSLVAFGGLLYRITGMAWGVAPQDIVPGEQWSVGHVPIILLGAVLVGFCWALPPPLLQLFEAAFTLLVNQ
jgi:hydrogenase-4 component F